MTVLVGLPRLTEGEAAEVRRALQEGARSLARARGSLDTEGVAGEQWDLALDGLEERMQDLLRLVEGHR